MKYIADLNEMCPIDFTPTEDGCCINNSIDGLAPPSISYTFENSEDINQIEAWNVRIQMCEMQLRNLIHIQQIRLELIDKLREVASKQEKVKIQ